MDAFYDADKVTVSPEQEMNLRRKIEAFTLDFNASLTSQVQTFEKNCKEHFQVIKRLKEAGSEVCGRALTTEDHLYYFQCGIFDSANPSRSTAGFHDLAMEVGQYGVELRKKNGTSFDKKFRILKGHILALQQIKNAKKLAKRTRERVNNVNGGVGRGGRGRGDGGRGGGPGRGGGGGKRSTKPRCRQYLDEGKCDRDNCGFDHPNDLSKIPICNAKSAQYCKLGTKCNLRHVGDENANVASSGSSGASTDQDSDVGSGDSDDDE